MVSVVVPVYNTEKYIRQCIESVLMQTYKDFELILVDDGSTDMSGAIIDEYASNDKRVKVIHKANQGVVSAREDGIIKASREYITFLDSDDWLDNNFIEVMLNKMVSDKSIDIAVSGMTRNYSSGKEILYTNIKTPYVCSSRAAMRTMMLTNDFKWELCGKVYKRLLFDAVQFDYAICYAEDLASNWVLFQNAENIWCDSSAYYHYRQHEASAMHMFDFARMDASSVWKRIIQNDWLEDGAVVAKIHNNYINELHKLFIELVFVSEEKYADKMHSVYDELKNELTNCGDLDEKLGSKLKYIKASYEATIDTVKEIYDNIVKVIKNNSCKSDKLYIYGTGRGASYIARICEEYDIDYCGFIVSDGQDKKDKFYNKPVLRVGEIKLVPNHAVIFGLSKQNAESVMQKICELNVIRTDLEKIF